MGRAARVAEVSVFFVCERSVLQVDDELEIKAYYAGHVLGAAMVLIKVGSESVVYTVSATRPVANINKGGGIYYHGCIKKKPRKRGGLK